jgi:small subunit ribosomal protein S6
MTTLVPSSEDVRIYETCVLYPHPLTQKEEVSLLKDLEALFTEVHAKEISRDLWGRRGLAYTIKGHNNGSFAIFYHEMKPENLKELESNMKLVPNVLRHLIVKPPKGFHIVDYSKRFAEWQQEQVAEEDRKKKEKEERLKKRMLKKSKPSTKTEKEETTPKAAKTDAKKISADIDSLLDGNDFSL